MQQQVQLLLWGFITAKKWLFAISTPISYPNIKLKKKKIGKEKKKKSTTTCYLSNCVPSFLYKAQIPNPETYMEQVDNQ